MDIKSLDTLYVHIDAHLTLCLLILNSGKCLFISHPVLKFQKLVMVHMYIFHFIFSCNVSCIDLNVI
jgi:hypothetical protein